MPALCVYVANINSRAPRTLVTAINLSKVSQLCLKIEITTNCHPATSLITMRFGLHTTLMCNAKDATATRADTYCPLQHCQPSMLAYRNSAQLAASLCNTMFEASKMPPWRHACFASSKAHTAAVYCLVPMVPGKTLCGHHMLQR
jgi:hypothetical protein